ncbi:MAG: PIN domain-containing protein [Nitrospinota bacterium]
MKTSKPLERLAADANVLLSAVVGRAALKVFTETTLPVVTTALNIEEIEEYLPRMASKYGLELEVVQAQLALLPLEVYEEAGYSDLLEEARRRLESRDPDDVHLLALALKLGVPIWSNDRDFEEAGVEVYPTAELLKRLGL